MISSALLFTACNDLTDGFSTDPVNITDESQITTDKFLSGVEVSLIGIYEGDINRLTGMWTGHFSGEDRQYIGMGNYAVTGRESNTEWAGVYSSVLKNVQIIKSRSRKEGNTGMLAIAQTVEAMTIGLAADLWGDVPYSEALQYPKIAEPKFDPQLEVYGKVQVLLDSAIENFALPYSNALRTRTAAADIFFAGNETRWIATANTLKARYYLHTRDYANAELYAESGIASVADNMMAEHGTSYLQNFNLFYSFLAYDRAGYMAGNGFAARLLDPASENSRNNAKTTEDARFNYFYIDFGDGTYDVNFANADDEVYYLDSDYDGYFTMYASFPMVTFEENALTLAEARMKQDDFAGALAALNSHRQYLNQGTFWNVGYNEFDFNYADYEEGDFEPNGIENQDGVTKEEALLREILEERYVTLVGQLEAFNDVRRTDNYLGIPVKPGSPSIPQRLIYAQAESNANKNVPTTGVGLFEKTPVNKTPY